MVVMKYIILLCINPCTSQTVFAQHEGHKCRRRNLRRHRRPAPSPQMPAEQPAMDMSDHMDHGVFVMHDDEMFIRLGQSESNLDADGPHGLGHVVAA